MATDSWLIRSDERASKPPSHSATLARNANSSVAIGNVPYAATSDSELALVRCDDGTRLGTLASLAGDHRSVPISSTSDAITRPHTVSMNGMVTRTLARRTSQATITFFRFHRST